MTRARKIMGGAIAILAIALLDLPPVHGQQVTAPAEDSSGGLTMTPPNARALAQALKPVMPNPFRRPGSTKPKQSEDNEPADSLLWQFGRTRKSALAEYDFGAPATFYSFNHNELTKRDWDSVASGAVTGYLTGSYTTYVRTTAGFSVDGEKRESGAIGQPGSQTFTMNWEAAHLLPTRLGPVEMAAGIYRQHVVSYATFANSPISDEVAGSSVWARGLEASLTIPDRNLTLSIQNGTQYLGPSRGKAHAMMFELSWTW